MFLFTNCGVELATLLLPLHARLAITSLTSETLAAARCLNEIGLLISYKEEESSSAKRRHKQPQDNYRTAMARKNRSQC